jgi:hypothetical protein
MDGTAVEGPLTRRIHRRQPHYAPPTEPFFRILREVEQGKWHLQEWADELGISEDEMLIELDRHLHQDRAA